MKFHLIQSDNKNLITGYDLNWVEVNQTRHESSLIMTPDRLFLEWSVKTILDMKENSFKAIESLDIEIILLGTGNTQEHLEPKLLEYFSKKNIAIESMSNQSACRTYNILANEERKVLLALML
jgi:uncharacterized protein